MKMVKFAVLMSFVLLMTGCIGKVKFEPASGSIFLKKNGGITGASVDTFDKPEYDVEELRAYVEEQVTAYNEGKTGRSAAYAEGDEILPVSIQLCEANEQQVTLLLDYASGGDYLEFNRALSVPREYFEGMEEFQDKGNSRIPVSLFNGTLEEMAAAGYGMDGSFVKSKDGSSVSGETILSGKNNYVAIIEGDAVVQVEGKIIYTTDNVTVSGDNGAVCESGGVSYIIYK